MKSLKYEGGKTCSFLSSFGSQETITMLYAYTICYMHIAGKKYDGKSALNTLLKLS